jgi:hypothetical protein
MNAASRLLPILPHPRFALVEIPDPTNRSINVDQRDVFSVAKKLKTRRRRNGRTPVWDSKVGAAWKRRFIAMKRRKRKSEAYAKRTKLVAVRTAKEAGHSPEATATNKQAILQALSIGMGPGEAAEVVGVGRSTDNVTLQEQLERLERLGLPVPVIEPDYEVFDDAGDDTNHS